MTKGRDNNIWYRQPMVWMIIAIPLTSVVLGVVMIVLAVNTNDGLVVDDYYKQGLEINRTLERDARARELKLVADVELSTGDNRISVRLSGRSAFEAPHKLELGFYHATRKGEDEVLTLRRDAQGVYSAPMPELSEGRWYVSAETTDWRLTHVIRYPVGESFTITARTPGSESKT